jgi:hypothetical protein
MDLTCRPLWQLLSPEGYWVECVVRITADGFDVSVVADGVSQGTRHFATYEKAREWADAERRKQEQHGGAKLY